MKWREAVKRGFRTFAQTLAGALIGLPTAQAVVDIRAIREPLLVALWVALMAGTVSVLQNLAEDNSTIQLLPK